MARRLDAFCKERGERGSGSFEGGIADGLPIPLELSRVVVDRPLEISVELVGEHGAKDGGPTRNSLLTGERRDDGRAHVVELHTEPSQDLCRDAFALPDQTQQEVLGADVLIFELTGFEE